MRPDDNLIISHLDDEWRTAPAVHRLLGERGAVADIAYALERLARGLHLLQDPEGVEPLRPAPSRLRTRKVFGSGESSFTMSGPGSPSLQ